jgi:hypothetical protein
MGRVIRTPNWKLKGLVIRTNFPVNETPLYNQTFLSDSLSGRTFFLSKGINKFYTRVWPDNETFVDLFETQGVIYLYIYFNFSHGCRRQRNKFLNTEHVKVLIIVDGNQIVDSFSPHTFLIRLKFLQQ